MNKKLLVARWMLMLLLIGSTLFVVWSSVALWQQSKVEAFIAEPTAFESIPDDPRAHFAQAASLENQQNHHEALDELTAVLADANKDLLPLAYFNRGNINLREALTMTAADARQIPLIELAKQDYRSALALNPEFWDARYNLEVALKVVSEDPNDTEKFEKKIIDSERSIESKAFKVDLP